MRGEMPMNLKRTKVPLRPSDACKADVARVGEIFTTYRKRHTGDGEYLFGRWSIADAMFAPVCSRFTTYAIPLEPRARTYVAYMMALPAMLEWARGASAEVARLAAEAPTTAEEWDEAPSHELAAPSKLEEMVEPEPPPPMVMPEPPPVARANVEIETPPQPRPPPPAEAPPTRIMPTPIAPKEVDPTSDAAAAEADSKAGSGLDGERHANAAARTRAGQSGLETLLGLAIWSGIVRQGFQGGGAAGAGEGFAELAGFPFGFGGTNPRFECGLGFGSAVELGEGGHGVPADLLVGIVELADEPGPGFGFAFMRV